MTDRPSARRERRVLLFALHLSYRTAAYQQAARRIGVPLTLASTATLGLTDARMPGIRVDDDAEKCVATVLDAARTTPFDAIVVTDDALVERASHVAEALGLSHNPPAAARFSRRKDLARERQREAGLAAPGFRLVDLEAPHLLPPECDLHWPAVLKPLAWSGSRGVMRVDNRAECMAAMLRLRAMLAASPPGDPFERRHALLEDFLPGAEVAVEGLMRDGDFQPLAVFDKPDPLDGPYFEETYYVTPSRHPPAVVEALYRCVAAVCAAYGLREGPVHAELRIGPDGTVHPLEVAARTIGGDCARLLRFGAGHGLEELVLASAVGLQLSCEPADPAGGVLMIPTRDAGILRRVEGVTAAQKVPYVEEIVLSVNSGRELIPLPEGSSYLGFIFARGPDPATVEAALREAHACLRVVTAPKLAVTLG